MPASSAQLRKAVAEFARVYGNDQTYRELVYQLEKAMTELDLLELSPGRREARTAAMPNPAGQEPQDRSEAPSYVQTGD